MSFNSLYQELKSEIDQENRVGIESIKKFIDLCIGSFTDEINLSKGNSQEFMAIMSIVTLIADKLTAKLIKLGDETTWFIVCKVAMELLMFKESNAFADAVIKFNDKNKLVWFYKGRYFEKEKNYEKAEEAFNKAISIDKEYYIAWFQIASMYEKIDLEMAYQKYLVIVEKFPDSMSGWKRLEEVGGKLGHYEVAMKAQKVSFELSNNPNRKK